MQTMSESSSPRLLSLDAFRGATIAAMILVNNPGDWGHIYPPLRHAEWNGCTYTDWIFPFFLYIVGVAMTYSFARQVELGADSRRLFLKIARRATIIFGLGLFLNGFPYFHLDTLRIPGVLQRIAICYLVCSFIMLNASIRAQVTWLVGFLVAYWVGMQFLPVPGVGAGVLEPDRNFSNWLDSVLLPGHMWSFTKTWDPEGVFSTLPAFSTTLFGVLAGHWLRSEQSREAKTAWMFVAGNLMVLVGLVVGIWLPINKSIWTSSYSVYTAGWATIVLATSYWLIDVQGYRRMAHPFVIYGTNAIAAYVLSGVVARLLGEIKVAGTDGRLIPLKLAIFQSVYLPVATPVNASLLFAVTFVGAMFLVVWGMYRRGWFLKV